MEPQQGTVLIGVVLVAVDLAIRITALIVIPRERKPTAAMAWLLAIFLVPYLGILFFLLIGSAKLPKKRRAKQAEVNRMIAAVPDVGGSRAKLVDDDTAVIGSNIMGTRSFALREATPFQCEKEPLRVTALDGLTRLTSALQ
jgi:Phospholipase_D-nuclease N-terminal